MNLVDCLKFLESVQELNTQYDADNFFIKCQAEIDACGTANVTDSNHSQILQKHQQLLESYRQYQNEISVLTDLVHKRIQQLDQTHLVTSYQTWEGGERHIETRHVIERGNQIDPITKEFLAVRLKTKTSWQWPNLVVRPLLAWHVENLVACDPTYFVDMDSILLDRINSWFTPEYQQRLCRYVYQEDMNQPMFDMLPENQFGLIYVPMVLNYRPIELIARYLNEFYCLLRPGGCLLFTFNNCDTVSAARLFEKFSGSYVPSRLLKPIAQSIGYKIVYEFNDVRATSWLELQKPGQLHSNRAGQTLAMIKPKLGQPIDQAEPIVPNIPAQSDNTPNSIDLQTIDVYNEFNVLLSVCEMLKIPRDKLLVKGQPSIKKMRKLITENLHSDQFPTEKIIRLLEKRKSQ